MLYTAFILGIVGSLHCVGMCGPIALALPVPRGQSRIIGLLLYNAGRILTYSLLGMAMGVAGQVVVLAGYQQLLSILCGVFIVGWVITPFLPIRLASSGHISRFQQFVKSQLATFLNQKSKPALLLLGVVNGLLPCGLVYVALASSLSMGDSLNGGLFMALFGMGTAPLMFAVGYSKHWFTSQWKARLNKAIPVFAFMTGVLLIVRGLHLGIPYVSPQISSDKPSCCSVKHH